MPGNNQVDISPDERTLAVVRSYTNRPPELYLQPNRPAPNQNAQAPNAPGANSQAAAAAGPEVKQVTTSPTPEFFTLQLDRPAHRQLQRARRGDRPRPHLQARGRPQRGGPAVIFVHGAGYLQNVHKWWSSYYREYMFHHLLAERGYTVLDIDYRGSAGYGRDWRTGIYRHMGGKDLTTTWTPSATSSRSTA